MALTALKRVMDATERVVLMEVHGIRLPVLLGMALRTDAAVVPFVGVLVTEGTVFSHIGREDVLGLVMIRFHSELLFGRNVTLDALDISMLAIEFI